ncbi:hypothetical protein [Clostridium kluyveri]|uniref:hypothetical protein n=1 Tax=Clostridium kluyveri TaxID=1534 RepID=UPI0018DBAE70|nr:hypothetical protein [Clostridium kluyveri]
MDFKLDIGELTNTINEYENIIKTLEEQKENINKTIAELTEAGWSGEAKDKFMEKHIKNQEFYTNLIEDIKYVKNALENEEKPRAVRLKKQSEDFVNCIKRSGGGTALTNDDTGIISLQYGGQFQINNNVSECIDNYKKMNSKFEEILNLANSLSFTSFPIADDVLNLQNSLKNQTTSLTEFNDSFNEYCNGVRDMEENICSVFSKISGITVGISEFRSVSAISENGQVDKNKVIQLMLKNPNYLTNGEKEILSYVEKVLSKDEYDELKEQVLKQKKNEELVSKIKDLIEGCLKIKKDLINDPVDSFKYLNSSVSKSDFGKVIKSSEYYPLVKYLTIRGEAITSGGINFVKALLELIKSAGEFGGELTNVAKIELDRIFGTNGMDNDETYKKALAKNAQELYYAGDNAYNIIKNIPKGIWEDIKTTGDINKIKDFFLNPDMSLDDAEKWTESTINLIGITRGGKALSKGKIPIHEKLSIGEDLKIPDMKTIGNIKTPGNKAENMTQYIRSVLYGQHQFALPNGMGTINASEDLFKFSKIEDNVSNEAKKIIEGAAEAGVGKTGEGIHLENVKPDVLKQIYADDNGAYGYLPNKGTEYDRSEYDFTDVDWAKTQQKTRADYLEASKQLESDDDVINTLLGLVH